MYDYLARRSLTYNINSIMNTSISDNPNNGINSPNTIKHMMSDIDAGFLRDVVLLLQYFLYALSKRQIPYQWLLIKRYIQIN